MHRASTLVTSDTLRGETTAAVGVETTARTTALAAEANSRTVMGSAIRGEFAAADAADVTNRNAAISSAIATEATTRANAITAEANQRTLVAAAIRSEFAAADSADVTNRNAAITAAVATETTARVNAISAEASQRSILASTVNGIGATVNTQAGTIATLTGRTAAFWEVTATAGGRASVRVYADANGGGGVDLVGDVRIQGNLLVSGTVNSLQLTANAATVGGTYYVSAAVPMSTGWQTAAEIAIPMIGGAAKVDFCCYVTGRGINSGTNVLYRLLRNGTEIRQGNLCLIYGEQTVFTGEFSTNPQPVYQPVASMFPFFLIDTAGATGNVTYTVQLRTPSSDYTYCNFAERQMSVTEFRR